MTKNRIYKIIILTIIIALVVAFFAFGFGDYFTLEYIKASQAKFAEYYAGNKVTVIALYMLVYIVSTSLSLPGAAMLTLLGGGMFGLLVGTIVVSFASSIGATLACFVSRFFIGAWVQERFGEKISVINEGVAKEGAFYLFSLRLIPIFPFWLINLLMGLTKIRLMTFYWVSQVGMLAGTIVYVNAGKELANITPESGLLTPGLIISFVILGLFPITIKKIMAYYKSRVKNAFPL